MSEGRLGYYAMLIKANAWNHIPKFLRYMLLACSMIFIVIYFAIVFFQIRYPFELHWMEGSFVDEVSRILSGQKLYVSPSLEFVPFMYTPLYFYVAAFMSKLVGIGFLPLRLVSFISILVCFIFIFLIVSRETRSKYSGILASCLFAATLHISGNSFVAAGVDSLFLSFLLVAVFLIRFATSTWSWVLAGVLISLSVLTKQTALVISIPIMIYCFLANRRGAAFLIGTVVTLVSITLILDYTNERWLPYYVFYLLRQHAVEGTMFAYFWIHDIIQSLPIAFSLSIFYVGAWLSHSAKKSFLFYVLVAIGMLGGSWLSRLHSGGGSNGLMPAYAVIAIICGLFVTILKSIEVASIDKRKSLESFVYIICIIQFVSLIWNPLTQIPTREDSEAGRELIQTIARTEGEVWIPYHGYLATMAGKNSHAHIMAIWDVLRGDNGQASIDLINGIRQAIREKRFSLIILDDVDWFSKETNIEEYYVRQGPVFTNETVFWPIADKSNRPQFFYVPKGQ